MKLQNCVTMYVRFVRFIIIMYNYGRDCSLTSQCLLFLITFAATFMIIILQADYYAIQYSLIARLHSEVDI